MKNKRIKQIDNIFYAQSRFNLFWFIPTPFWVNYHQTYGDIVLGDVIEIAAFDTQEECYRFLYGDIKEERKEKIKRLNII